MRHLILIWVAIGITRQRSLEGPLGDKGLHGLCSQGGSLFAPLRSAGGGGGGTLGGI